MRRFFARFPGRNRRDLGRVEIEVFLGEMARRNDISNWQIAQARDALELYYEQFRGISLAPRPDSNLPTPPSPVSMPSSRERDMAPAIVGQFVQKQITQPLERRQATPASVKASKDAPKPVQVAGKTNWGLLEARVRETLRVAHYSYRTEQTYLAWIRQFVEFHQWQKPSTMDADHVRDFLRHLAMDRQVASSTQNQALNAVVFLFKSALKLTAGRLRAGRKVVRGECSGEGEVVAEDRGQTCNLVYQRIALRLTTAPVMRVVHEF